MSGSGRGGYIPPQSSRFDCNLTIITTTVSSIDTDVLSKHQVGDVLDVVLSPTNTLILEDGDGEILGSIVHINTPDIIECINNAAVYEAEIIRIASPACYVRIMKKYYD